MNFEDFEWHDSILKTVYIDRKDPGEKDEIVLVVDSVNEECMSVVFKEVRWMSLSFNGGIVADENILYATILPESDKDLKRLYKKWDGYLDGVDLKVYFIEMSSTASIIKIIAEKVDIINSTSDYM